MNRIISNNVFTKPNTIWGLFEYNIYTIRFFKNVKPNFQKCKA